jgi:hypothetical protein
VGVTAEAQEAMGWAFSDATSECTKLVEPKVPATTVILFVV